MVVLSGLDLSLSRRLVWARFVQEA